MLRILMEELVNCNISMHIIREIYFPRLRLPIAWLGGDPGMVILALQLILEPPGCLDLGLLTAELDAAVLLVPCSFTVPTFTLVKTG